MNRRGFMKLLGAATALSAGGIALIETPKTIFLPPTGGWWQPSLRMRELEQYLINTDSMQMRWDAAWMVNGQKMQHYVIAPDIRYVDTLKNPHIFEVHREAARAALQDIRRKNGYAFAEEIELQLPRGVAVARYV